MTVGTLVDFLKEQSDKGVSHIYLSQAARDAVRSAIKANKPQEKPLESTVPEQKLSLSPARATPSRPPRSSAPRREVPAQKVTVIPPDSVEITLPAGDQNTQYQSLREQAESWAPALSLQSMWSRLVFGAGNASADLMIVGDAPGFDDEVAEVPFSGKSGQKLDQILKAMGIERGSIYLTNICKMRPRSPRQTTDVRKPTVQEVAAWMPMLQKEIEVVKPRCVLALGATATQAMLRKELSEVAQLRGTWQEFHGVPLLPSYHPVFLLRNANDKVAKRKMWEDMLAVMERLSLPISEKQRGFFT